MPSSNDALGGDRSRRELLAATGGLATLAVAGCSERLGGTEPEGEGDTVEIIVGDGTDEPVQIAVRVEDDNRDGGVQPRVRTRSLQGRRVGGYRYSTIDGNRFHVGR